MGLSPQNDLFLEKLTLISEAKFNYQTWPSSMISQTYGRSKLTSKMANKAVSYLETLLYLSKLVCQEDSLVSRLLKMYGYRVTTINVF